MPYCRECHKEISRLDNDVCPFCGTKNPIDESYNTMDVTTAFEALEETPLHKVKSKKTMFWLCLLLGFLGIHYFYIGLKKRGLISILLSLAIVGGIGTAIFLLVKGFFYSYLICFGALKLIDIVAALIISGNQSIKDSEGEFLR